MTILSGQCGPRTKIEVSSRAAGFPPEFSLSINSAKNASRNIGIGAFSVDWHFAQCWCR